MEDHRANMSNYIGNEIGQLILDNQRSTNDKVDKLSERLVKMEERLDRFEVPTLWAKVRSHERVLYMVWGAGLVVGWFAKVILGR